MEQIRLAIIDDHPAFRAGLSSFVEHEPAMDLVGGAGDAKGALELAEANPIDVAIVNVLAPAIEGITLVHDLHKLRPQCTVLGLSSSQDPSTIATMLRAGANGVVLKSQACADITNAVRMVARGERYLPNELETSEIDAALDHVPISLEALTQREREVFELLLRGFRNHEICERLFIARRTVETHRQRIFKKLSVHSVMQMMRVATVYGLVS